MLHSRTKKMVDTNIVQIDRSPNEIVEQDITLKLDTDQKFFDVYVNGVLVKRDAYCDHTFEDITLCSFTPFVQFKHVTTQVRFINNLPMPNARPGKYTIFVVTLKQVSEVIRTHVFLKEIAL